MNRLLLSLLLPLMLLLSSCEKSAVCDCFKGTGSETTETRAIAPFHYLEMYNKVDVYVHYATETYVTVTCGKHLIEKVTTESDGGVLRIENENKCNWVRDFENTFSVHVYTPVLDTFEVYNSSGNVYFVDTVKADQFRFESWSSSGDYHLKLNCGTAHIALQTGPGSLYAEGRIGVGYLWNQGQGVYDARNLVIDDIYTNNRGMNDQFLNARERLYAKIEFMGNIYYTGPAEDLQFENYGSGNFIQF